MRDANPLWGAPRIHGELQQLGIAVAQATVAKYLGRRSDPPSHSWRTFLTNHVSQLASIDFFTVPTATFRVLFVFVVLSHDRRRVVHVNVTAHPTAAWTGQQLREAWPWDTAPRFVSRDRDAIYGSDARRTVQQLGIEEVLTAPRCPWQNPFVERMIGSLRRECLDHVIVLNERSLHRPLQRYLAYYHKWRTHLSLDKDAPVPRVTQPPACGTIVPVPHVGDCITTTNVAPPELALDAASFGRTRRSFAAVVRRTAPRSPDRHGERKRSGFWSRVLASFKHTIGAFTRCGWSFW
jgi:putative transposase